MLPFEELTVWMNAIAPAKFHAQKEKFLVVEKVGHLDKHVFGATAKDSAT
ncbi:MAG: hypothetical protein IKG21_05310 [Atopobiaceae bacterium]|nr:hypothetical protein [Atopobiaceae bacterium]